MKKILFLLFHGFEPSNGISKKIHYQIEALRANGTLVHLCYMDEHTSKKRMLDNDVLIDYGSTLISKIKKRIGFSSIAHHAITEQYDMVYIRSNHNANPFTIHLVKKIKKAGIKVVMEIPTYPYDQEYVNINMKWQLFPDRIFRHQLARHLDAIITYSDDEYIFGRRTIKISNGIDFERVRIKQPANHSTDELHLIGVAEIHRWHGFDRVLKGLANYYQQHPYIKVFFHIVGFFFSPIEEKEITSLITAYHLQDFVIIHGKQQGEALDELFDMCDFGIGSLARHRVGLYKMKTLKNREYAARGIPFIYSENDDDFDDQPYVLKAPADESPIDIQDLLNFYKHQPYKASEIRASISSLSWFHQMGIVVNALFAPSKRIAYCIPSLYHSGGMERVLTTKVNYLADKLGYDIHIITTDGKGTKPYFPLSSKVTVWQLDINIDELWNKPFYKRLITYAIKMRTYKKRLTELLFLIHPEYTISLLRREINFLTSIKDGSKKIGEIHFGRYKYREAHFKGVPNFINSLISKFWMFQLENKLHDLHKFIVLTHEDATNWKGMTNIQVIPNPITITNKDKPQYGNKQVIAVGRYTHQKGFDLLIKAWEKVARKHHDWILNIYGSGETHPYQHLIELLGLKDTIKLHSATNDITKQYISSSIFVLSSRYEGLPLVLLESMSCALPPVSFACPCGPKDIIQHGINGLLCEPENIQQLADNLCVLMEDEQLREKMGQAAALSISDYNIPSIMQKWNQLFSEQ